MKEIDELREMRDKREQATIENNETTSEQNSTKVEISGGLKLVFTALTAIASLIAILTVVMAGYYVYSVMHNSEHNALDILSYKGDYKISETSIWDYDDIPCIPNGRIVGYAEYIQYFNSYFEQHQNVVFADGYTENPYNEFYTDKTKRYIIVSNSFPNSSYLHVKLRNVRVNHISKMITVDIGEEHGGYVAGGNAYMIAIPTDCDSSYTVVVNEYYTGKQTSSGYVTAGKPVIYLYPEKEEHLKVELDFDGEITSTYPKYNNGWEITAYPDGTLVDNSGRESNYLFWEGTTDTTFDFSKGFCVKGEDTLEFLEEALTKLGLTDKEQADFISYWLPKMEHNNYNIISFQDECYTNIAKLTTTTDIDTEIRVYMAWKPSDIKIDIEEQELMHTERKGFTIVEWGGSEVQ